MKFQIIVQSNLKNAVNLKSESMKLQRVCLNNICFGNAFNEEVNFSYCSYYNQQIALQINVASCI